MTYSEIVDELQGDKEKAGEFLVKVAIEQQKTLKNIKSIEAQLEKANRHYNSTMKEIELVCKHIEMPNTFHIVKDKKYYLFNKNQTTITNIDWEL